MEISSSARPCNHLSDHKLRHGGIALYKNLRDSIFIGFNGQPSVCSSISCPRHALSHALSYGGHAISVDVKRAELFCSKCADQVYNPDFDSIVVRKFDGNSIVAGGDSYESIAERLSKRRRLLGRVVMDMDSKRWKHLRDQREKSCYPFGLRGLNNLGNTCFMNSVLQA